MNFMKLVIILGHALIGWALCAATMAIGMAVTSLKNTLIIHAIAAPIFFAIVSLIYFRKFHCTTPLQTAMFFVCFVMVVDFFVVGLLILRSLEMFASFLGTWFPLPSYSLPRIRLGDICKAAKVGMVRETGVGDFSSQFDFECAIRGM